MFSRNSMSLLLEIVLCGMCFELDWLDRNCFGLTAFGFLEVLDFSWLF